MAWLSHPGNVVVNTIYGWSGTFEPDVPVHVPDVAERECRAVGCVDAEPGRAGRGQQEIEEGRVR